MAGEKNDVDSASDGAVDNKQHGHDASLRNDHEAHLDSESEHMGMNKGAVLSSQHSDPVLNAKMHLVNAAIDEIGFTNYHWKLFILNGFGYAVDSLILLIQSVIAEQARREFNPGFDNGLTIAVYVGMLVGALFWGLSADMIGRKYAFNLSLLIAAVFTVVAGASPNWIVLAFFVACSAFGAGGNLVLDTAVFLEYLPNKDQWLLTLMASWWGVGQLVAGLFAWAFIPNFSCEEGEECNWDTNPGWRYVWFACGSIVFVLSMCRVTVIKLRETPKFLVGEGRDAEVVETLQFIATTYNRPCSLTLEKMQACGVTRGRYADRAKATWYSLEGMRRGLTSPWYHIKSLFAFPKLALSTTLIWSSWLLIGLAYPLFNVFLPIYLATRSDQIGGLTVAENWRNYTLVNMCGIFSPILAGFMCRSRYFWGRRGTMIIGALVTMAFFFAYTTVTTNEANAGFACAINFCLNIYYGTLYAYTPEVLPSAHRGTGNGISIGLNRIMGILSAVIADVADTSSEVPIYLCAALYIVMAIVAASFPFEPMGNSSS